MSLSEADIDKNILASLWPYSNNTDRQLAYKCFIYLITVMLINNYKTCYFV